MTDPAREPYRRWRIFVFAVVIVVAPLTVGGLVAAAATTLPSLLPGGLSRIAAGASTGSPGAVTSSTETAPTDSTPAQPSESSAPVGPTVNIARDSEATASTTAPDNVDGGNSRISYGPQNMLDGQLSTAWRTKGNGIGTNVTITFLGRARLTEVGLVPGYAKTDPVTGVNRFYQDHRITAVNWVFSNGDSAHQEFTDSPSMQTIPVDTVADSVTIGILGVLPADEGYDYTPISEVTLLGAYG